MCPYKGCVNTPTRKGSKANLKKTLIILGVLIACYLDRNLQASPRKLLTPLKIKNYHK
ncbi:hypothetical protein B711_0084 [Chlamydia psittaci CP3]|nr:hypothetical protein B711_0084 [Chlamydia psittaci CP3]EPJ25533.1 hypothetical protein CP09DC77_0490 [Chlamydia psittaci 09DC77]